MNILFDINHPGHVHLFKNAIQILKKDGHNIIITSRVKDITVELLDNYKMDHIVLSKATKGLFLQACELIWRQIRLLPILLKNKIQICISVTGACNVHICKVLNIPTLIFYDTEHASLQNNVALPFATAFITPDSFIGRYGKKHITYNGTHDLAYLHPKYFTPNKEIYSLLNLSVEENFVVIRFVSWQATHDRGQSGISLKLKRKIINLCSQYAKLFIVSESTIDEEFEKYRFPIAPEKMHDTLNFATMYIGEGGSMATEAAILGTPAIFISSLTAGVFDEYENNYQLMYSFQPDQEAEILQKIETLLKMKNLKGTWEERKKKFLNDKEDLTQFMIKLIYKYAMQ